jgi:hypothetical protein
LSSCNNIKHQNTWTTSEAVDGIYVLSGDMHKHVSVLKLSKMIPTIHLQIDKNCTIFSIE